MDTQSHCRITEFRTWQSEGIKKFIKNFHNKKVEVTIAHQGSGKTLYAAGCFGASFTQSKEIDTQAIKSKIEDRSDTKVKDFAIVFVPKVSILQSTIRDWKSLGLNLTRIKNSKLKNELPENLIKRGFHGIILTYAQATFYGYQENEPWQDNCLIKFLSRGNNLKFHATLDEAHVLNIKFNKYFKPYKKNLAAKFFTDNEHYFFKIHLLSGTLIKNRFCRVPFVLYSEDGKIKPDTLYTKQQSINDKNVVPTKIAIHKIETLEVKVNNKNYMLTDQDFSWYQENAVWKITVTKTEEEKDLKVKYLKRLKNIEYAVKELQTRLDLWRQLLLIGTTWLKDVQTNHYKRAKGIIFCPSVAIAFKLHQELLRNNSILCVSKNANYDFKTVNAIGSDSISNFLNSLSEDSPIDWIVTCEALNEGFDYPDLKVSILIPRLEFLSFRKISQSLGRINRAIKDKPNLHAICLTLNYDPVIDLIKRDEEDMYGLISPESAYSELVNYANEEVIQQCNQKTNRKVEKDEHEVRISNFKIASGIETYFNNILVKENYDKKIVQELEEIRIRTYYTHWDDVIWANTENYPEDLPPINKAGCYTIVNAKTQAILYIGSSHDLQQRISNKKRYRETKWIDVEGRENLYICWELTPDYKAREKELKRLHPPKFDGEK